MTKAEIETTILRIKRQLMRSMNGIVALQMNQAGLRYTRNYGVEIPRINQLASTLPHDEQLASELWNLSFRETMLLAILICPHSAFDRTDAHEWISKIPTYEIAEFASRKLFSRLANAKSLAFELLNGKDFEPICGWLIISNLLFQIDDQRIIELKNMAIQQLSKPDLFSSLMLFFRRLAQEKKHLCHDLLVLIKKSSTTTEQRNLLYEEVKTQLEFS